MKNNLLDEMQEMKLLKIESIGCWIGYWGLFAAYMVQLLMGMEFRYYAGELIVFGVMCAYLLIVCGKNGLWSRHLQPNAKTNLLVSIIAAVVFGAVFGIRTYLAYGMKLLGSIATFAVITVFLFVLLFVTLSITSNAIRKKNARLEAESEDEDEP